MVKGYYWVKFDNFWQVALFAPSKQDDVAPWYLPGYAVAKFTTELQSIDGGLIQVPEHLTGV